MTINTFPLYDSIVGMIDQKVMKKDLTKKQKEYFVSHVGKLTPEAKELIYTLVIYFSRDNSVTSDNVSLPYNGQFVDNGVVEYNFNIFPSPLKQILYKFMHLHFSNVE